MKGSLALCVGCCPVPLPSQLPAESLLEGVGVGSTKPQASGSELPESILC